MDHIKKYVICRLMMTLVGLLNLTRGGVFERGDGWDHNRPGYYGFKEPLRRTLWRRDVHGTEHCFFYNAP